MLLNTFLSVLNKCSSEDVSEKAAKGRIYINTYKRIRRQNLSRFDWVFASISSGLIVPDDFFLSLE